MSFMATPAGLRSTVTGQILAPAMQQPQTASAPAATYQGYPFINAAAAGPRATTSAAGKMIPQIQQAPVLPPGYQQLNTPQRRLGMPDTMPNLAPGTFSQRAFATQQYGTQPYQRPTINPLVAGNANPWLMGRRG